MACAELAILRQDATAVFKELSIGQRSYREYAAMRAAEVSVPPLFLRRGDFESYLRRRLSKNAARIEFHIATHRCQI